jgi:type II secretory pathway predicted ATPase ExeA
MYTDFFNLKEKPFELNPSSRFLYLGEVHKEALALLAYGVSERKGFTLLTGEVGTGKTTMVHALISRLNENCQYVYLSNPVLSISDFFSYLAASVFKKKIQFKTKAEFLLEFEEFLKNCLQHQKNFILIIDEAHKLSFELLEEIRLLSNMETADEKLINIFLAGQPELNEKLSSPECRALLQRINTRYHINPLDLRSTEEYISTRLKMAGCAQDEQKIFSKGVIKALHHYSEGYPRMINILADNVLLNGYSRGTKKIIPSMVKECYDDLQLDRSFEKGTTSRAEAGVLEEAHQAHGIWKWATAVLSFIAISSFAFYCYKEDVFGRLAAIAPFSNKTESDKILEQSPLIKRNIEQKQQENATNNTAEEQEISAPPSGIEDSGVKKTVSAQSVEQTPPSSSPVPTGAEGEVPEGSPYFIGQSPKDNNTVAEIPVTVKEGDTIIGLAIDIYGRSGEDIFRQIRERNPEINHLDRIAIGQKIVFPVLPETSQGFTFTVQVASYEPSEAARNLFKKLLKQGHEAYLIPVSNSKTGKFFRITLGNFKTHEEAEGYAKRVIEDKISDYAKVIQLEMR